MAESLILPSEDESVQATNDDATSSKKYAVDQGYWKDDYVQFFCRSAEKRTPEICRGYYARVLSIQKLLVKFLKLTSCDCHVINLGAGFDSTYWTMRDRGLTPRTYIDIDFPEVNKKKCQIIKKRKQLLEPLSKDSSHSATPTEISSTELHSAHYHVLSCDLRKVGELSKKLLDLGFDTNTPTFILSECVLVYMSSESSNPIIEWAGKTFSTAIWINYEPILPDDRFGQTMLSNLKYRGCALLGIDSCPDLTSQRQRFLNYGWSHSWALDMCQVYSLLPRDDVARIERLDFLDEKELLTQLLQHYTLSCGFKDTKGIGLERVSLEDKTL